MPNRIQPKQEPPYYEFTSKGRLPKMQLNFRQTGVAAPIVVVRENGFGTNLTWSRVAIGHYQGVATVPGKLGTTTTLAIQGMIISSYSRWAIQCYLQDANTIVLKTYFDNVASDDITLNNGFIELLFTLYTL